MALHKTEEDCVNMFTKDNSESSLDNMTLRQAPHFSPRLCE
jgi:hypothetical protein